MENKNNTNQDCGCSDGCCTPSKNSPWKKWLFVAVILAAGVIVAFKFAGNQVASADSCCAATENTACCTETTPEPGKDASCCSEETPKETSSCCSEAAPKEASSCCSEPAPKEASSCCSEPK